MKNIVLSAAFALSATSAFAGGLNQPVPEAEIMPVDVVEAGSSSSGSGILVPLFALVLFAAAASN
ncbi:hypothetical protein [Halocynthiibacter namhaensis]|uniref:hypothetical protein n=1 Tax=Halocynthiibacter namhaensis TaxID=1290553 RepID=UPI000579621A|nr:hypothetical protein [Halocynthiibacter namhaensis]